MTEDLTTGNAISEMDGPLDVTDCIDTPNCEFAIPEGQVTVGGDLEAGEAGLYQGSGVVEPYSLE